MQRQFLLVAEQSEPTWYDRMAALRGESLAQLAFAVFRSVTGIFRLNSLITVGIGKK
jgi:hypothetical protein